MMRSKSRPAKIKFEGKAKKWKAKSKPKSASEQKSKKERTKEKLPYTIKIELSQGGQLLHEETRSLSATLGEEIVPLVKGETLDWVSRTALLRYLQKKAQTGTLAVAPNGNIIARFGKGKKKEVLLVYAGNEPFRGTFALFRTSPLSGLFAFGTDEQQDRIIEIAQASRE